MSLSGSAIVHAPFLWTDRGNINAHGRKQQEQPLPLPLEEPWNETNKTAVFPSPNSTPGFSVNTTRALTIKHKKMRNRQWKNKDNEVMATMPQTSLTAPVDLRPTHLDLFEALGKRGPGSETVASDYCIETLKFSGSGSGLGGSNAGRQSPGPGSDQVYRHMGYNEYMAQAVVRSGEGREISPTGKQQDLAGAGPSYQRQSDDSANSMEVCVRMSAKQSLDTSGKERRPKIQVTIPKTRTRSYPVVPPTTTGKERPPNRRQNTGNTVSPPSTTSGQRSGSEIPARLSIVSPLSVMEMPKPRRPFSKFSFEEISTGMSDSTPLLSKSASSDSSDDTGDLDDKSSNYSPRSSVSSLTSDPVVKKPVEQTRGSVAFSVISPTAAGVFDPMELNPHTKKRRGMKSTTCLSEKIDRNKPLPPEPGFRPVKPLAFSRATSMKSRGKAPAPLQVFRQSSFNVPRSRDSQFLPLRSKYTPADLDALDDAFQKSSPPYLLPPLYGYQQSPTLSQAELALEAHLGTISEDALQDPNAYALMHQPLQISRGPMHMEPSRKPPALPSSLFSVEDSRKKIPKRIPTHVALQLRADRDPWGRPISTMPVHATGSISKAHRILGRTPIAYPMERNTSADSNWSSSDSHKAQTSINAIKSANSFANSPIKTPASSFTSQENLPQLYSTNPSQPHPATSASPDVSSEDSDNPDAEEPSVPDAAFEEVRRRLELLSPRDDASQIFLAFHEKIRAEEALNKRSTQELPAHQITTQELPAYELPAHELTSRQPLANRPHPLVIIPQRSESPKQIYTQAHRPPPIEINAASERDIQPLQQRGRRYEASIRSIGSIAISEIPDIYASLPSPKSVQRQSMTPEEVERMISAEAAEQVLLRILENLDNLQDLFNTATVSRGFYRTFKRHELPLMKNALYGMSPAAWELREMSPPHPGLHGAENLLSLGYTPSLYLQHYMRDMYIMIALKSMILVHCQTFLRADTITALAGGETVRNSQIDDAFWRVWTFCCLFGFGTNREDDIVGQMDWLKGGPLAKQQKRNTSTVDMGVDVDMNSVTVNPSPGFAQGNSGGLSAEDLYDMTEIWTCLGVLVRGFQGKRKEAREYGIFDKADITAGNMEQEDALLGKVSPLHSTIVRANVLTEEWTYHLLTLAPPTILDVTSPKSPTIATFAHARAKGYTSWTPPPMGASRSTFLKEAVSRVYSEKMTQRHPTINIVSSQNSSQPYVPTADEIQVTRLRIAAHGAEIRAKRNDPAFKALAPSEERPMSNFPDVIAKLDDSPATSTSTATPSSLAPSSTYLQSSVTPLTTAFSTPASQPFYNRSASTDKELGTVDRVPMGPQVRDPVDIAVDRLVAMGFEEKKAKKALAETDTGESIDFDKAVEILVRERKRDVSNMMNWNYRGAAQTNPPVEDSQIPIGLGIGGVPRYS